MATDDETIPPRQYADRACGVFSLPASTLRLRSAPIWATGLRAVLGGDVAAHGVGSRACGEANPTARLSSALDTRLFLVLLSPWMGRPRGELKSITIIEERILMSKVTLFSFVLVLSVLYLPMATPVAAQDVKTCSGNLAFCKKGVASRGVPDTQCRAAHAECLKTGVWQTQGPGGRRVEGLVRK